MKIYTEYVPQNTGFTSSSWFDGSSKASTLEEAKNQNIRHKRLNQIAGCKYRVVKRTMTEEVVYELS